MIAIVWNILLALAWVIITGSFTIGNLALGVLVGFLVLVITQRGGRGPTVARRVINMFALAFFVAYELVLSNIRVAFDVMKPRRSLRSAVIALPLDAETDTEITLLAAVITLTPGTTAIGLSPDRRTMYVHVVNLRGRDAEFAKLAIKHGFERRVLEVLR